MTTTPKSCEQCGEPHVLRGTERPSCAAHRKADGRPCGQPPRNGQKVCRKHGGNTAKALSAAQRRLEAEAANRMIADALAEAYAGDVPVVDPAEAMLQAVSWKHAEVVALRAAVATLGVEERVWGTKRKKFGGEDHGTTMEAGPHIWWQMLRASEDQLVKYAAAARAAGCDEARVRLAEEQGRMVAATIQRSFAAMLGWVEQVLTDAGHTDALQLLAAAWSEQVRQIVPRELRAISAAPEQVPA